MAGRAETMATSPHAHLQHPRRCPPALANSTITNTSIAAAFTAHHGPSHYCTQHTHNHNLAHTVAGTGIGTSTAEYTNHVAASFSATSEDLKQELHIGYPTPRSIKGPDDHDYRALQGEWHYSVHPPHHTSHALPAAYSGLKSESSFSIVDMANPPPAPASDQAKHEYHDDASSATMRDDHRSNTPLDGRIEMDQDEVDAIIRNKRKVRDPKACYACHRRKVKCDRNLPCDACVKRDHPELCSYERPTKKKRIAMNSNVTTNVADGTQPDMQDVPPASGPNITVPREQWERINTELQKLREALDEARPQAASQGSLSSSRSTEIESEEPLTASNGARSEREGIHARSTQMGTMHLGSSSVLAYMVGDRSKSSQDAARLLLEENILPNLGLDNETATYPFVDLWSTESSISDVSGLCRGLPEDALILEFWTSYRDVACTIYPVVPDKVQFEQTLHTMLLQRSDHNRRGLEIDPNKPYGVSMPWLALVFSVMASGAQCGMLPAKERELTSQVYICCAYQALRMANFLSHPCLETIEACLIIGNALSYNMNPGVSYTFIGMTLRSALTMGLHVNSQNFTEHETYLRGRIWWALAWQDSHFSISYDRPSTSILCFPEIPYTKISTPGTRSYVESLSAIIRLTQEILRDRTLNPSKAVGFHAIAKYKEAMSRIINDSAPRLKDRSLCTTTIEHMERCAFKLHSSYMLSEICRPALKESSKAPPTSHPTSSTPQASPRGRRKSSLSAQSNNSAQSPPGSNTTDPFLLAQLRAECVNNLERSVEAYVELHSHSIFACRSWVGIQRSISAAFLLGIVPETRQEPRVQSLLMELERCIARRTAEDVGFANSGSPVSRSRNLPMVVHDESRLGIENSPNWARSMTKSLNALSKLNAALAASTTAINANIHQQDRRYLKTHNQQTAAGMYATPVVSPVASGAVGATAVSHTTAGPSGAQISQYQPATMPAPFQHHNPTSQGRHTGLGSPPTVTGSPAMSNHSSSTYLGGTTSIMAPVTPDSACSNGDWHYGNLAERALEYVQPGLWG